MTIVECITAFVFPTVLFMFVGLHLFLRIKGISLSKDVKDIKTMRCLFDGWQIWQRGYGKGISTESIISFNKILKNDDVLIKQDEKILFDVFFSSMRDDAATLFLAGENLFESRWEEWIKENKKEIKQIRDPSIIEDIRYYVYCFTWLDRVTKKNTTVRGLSVDSNNIKDSSGSETVIYKMLYACASLIDSIHGTFETDQAIVDAKRVLNIHT